MEHQKQFRREIRIRNKKPGAHTAHTEDRNKIEKIDEKKRNIEKEK